jgi:hypothetical protein
MKMDKHISYLLHPGVLPSFCARSEERGVPGMTMYDKYSLSQIMHNGHTPPLTRGKSG